MAGGAGGPRGAEPWRREWLLSPGFPRNPALPSWVTSRPGQSPPLGTGPCAAMAFRGLQGHPSAHPNPNPQNPTNPEVERLRGSPCVGRGRSLPGGPPRACGGPRLHPRPWLGCERSWAGAGIVSRAPGRNKPCPEGGSAAPGMSPDWFSRQEIPGKGPGDAGLGCPCVPTGLGRVPEPRVSWRGR